jgi:hypothetical protein
VRFYLNFSMLFFGRDERIFYMINIVSLPKVPTKWEINCAIKEIIITFLVQRLHFLYGHIKQMIANADRIHYEKLLQNNARPKKQIRKRVF